MTKPVEKKTSKKRGPAGKGVELTDEVLRQIGLLAQYGMTIEQISAFFSISTQTFYNYMKKDDRIGVLIEKARATGAAAVTRNLYQMATATVDSGRKDENGKPIMVADLKALGAACFYAKTRLGWRETNVIEHAGGIDIGKKAAEMTPTERRARIKELGETIGLTITERPAGPKED